MVKIIYFVILKFYLYKKYSFLALNEYKACLIFNENTSHDYLNESMKKKLLKRSDIVIKYLKNIQTSIFHIMDNKCCKLYYY